MKNRSSLCSQLRLLTLSLLLTNLFLSSARAQSESVTNSPASIDSSVTTLELLEVGTAVPVRSPIVLAATVPAEIKIVSYNIRYRGGEDLRRLIEMLRHDREIGGAGIIGLQEVDRNTRRVGGVNTARVMAESLGLHYAWAAPPRTRPRQTEDETGVAILSAYPLANVERLVLPHAGPGGRRRVAIGATARLPNGVRVRVYSVHAETRVPHRQKMEQYRAVLDAVGRTSAAGERAIVLGDFNTIEEKSVRDTSAMFAGAGFSTPFPNDQPTWRFYFLRLKLDWLWLRGFGRVTDSSVVRRIGLSDHWPLWINVIMDNG